MQTTTPSVTSPYKPKPAVLVTGATGFLGRRLVAAMVSGGQRVRVLTRATPSTLPSDDHGPEFVIGDLTAPETLRGCCDGISKVFHLASYSPRQGTAIQDHDAAHWQVTVEGTKNLASEARRAGVQRIVFASSVKTMGECTEQCLTEQDPSRPGSGYGTAKLAAEEWLRGLGDIEISILRFAPLYGPLGEGWVNRLAAAMNTGWVPPLPRMENRRSMVHVDDAAASLILAGMHERAVGNTFLVTDGFEYSTRAIYEAICTALGRPVPNWGIPLTFFDIAAALSETLGWWVGKQLPFGRDVRDVLFRSAWYSNARLCKELDWQPKRNLFESLPEIISTERDRHAA